MMLIILKNMAIMAVLAPVIILLGMAMMAVPVELGFWLLGNLGAVLGAFVGIGLIVGFAFGLKQIEERK